MSRAARGLELKASIQQKVPTRFILLSRGRIIVEVKDVEGGNLGTPSLLRDQCWWYSHANNNLQDLDNGDGVEVTRGSPGWQ